MGYVEMTPEEDAAMTERVMLAMEEKYITNRTPERFSERVAALEPNKAKAAAKFETKPKTFHRWRTGQTQIPGVAFVALDLMERANAPE